MAGRGTRTPAQTGRRANIDIGSMVGGGSGPIKGGPEVLPQSGPMQDGTSMPPIVTNTPYSVKHPVLDAIFNRGAGQAQANTANLSMSMDNANAARDFGNSLSLLQKQQQFQTGDRAQGQVNALAIQQNQQLFDLKKQQIEQNNMLSRDQKLAEINKATALAAQHHAVLTGANVLATPESEQDYIGAVNPTMIQAAMDKGSAASTASRLAATGDMSKLDAMQTNYPALVSTGANQIQTGRIASEGALAQQPVINKNAALVQELQPTIISNEALKSRFMPSMSGLYDLGSGRVTVPSPAQQKQNGAMQIMQMLGNGGNAPTTVGGFPGGITPPVINGGASQAPFAANPDGSFTDPNGTVYYPDGRVVRKPVVTP